MGTFVCLVELFIDVDCLVTVVRVSGGTQKRISMMEERKISSDVRFVDTTSKTKIKYKCKMRMQRLYIKKRQKFYTSIM